MPFRRQRHPAGTVSTSVAHVLVCSLALALIFVSKTLSIFWVFEPLFESCIRLLRAFEAVDSAFLSKASCLPKEAVLELWDDMILCSGLALLVPLSVALLEQIQSLLLKTSGSTLRCLELWSFVRHLGCYLHNTKVVAPSKWSVKTNCETTLVSRTINLQVSSRCFVFFCHDSICCFWLHISMCLFSSFNSNGFFIPPQDLVEIHCNRPG